MRSGLRLMISGAFALSVGGCDWLEEVQQRKEDKECIRAAVQEATSTSVEGLSYIYNLEVLEFDRRNRPSELHIVAKRRRENLYYAGSISYNFETREILRAASTVCPLSDGELENNYGCFFGAANLNNPEDSFSHGWIAIPDDFVPDPESTLDTQALNIANAALAGARACLLPPR